MHQKVKITGEMDGEKIWRHVTSEDHIQEILAQYPPSTVNNSRSIVKRKLESMDKYPSVAKAQELEGMIDGISVDFGHFEGSGSEHDISNPSNEPY